MEENNKLEEIIKEHPSICYSCEHARKPASDENIKKGYVGCCLRAIDNRGGISYDWDEIVEAKEVAEGWVDLKRRMVFGRGSGIITNLMILTLEVKSCKQYKEA